MSRIVVVGSGAAGVHFALSALENGHQVDMVDIGLTGEGAPLPDADYEGLRTSLDDPCRYFLGDDFQSVALPSENAELYRTPPSKEFVFRETEAVPPRSEGFRPSRSGARGGLAEAWTAGCYPFDDHDLGTFPFDFAELEPYYAKVAQRIGVSGAIDDLAPRMPAHDGLLDPIVLDGHSRALLSRYERRRASVQETGVRMGRSRVATLSRALGDRQPCDYLGRCLWGCPRRSIYTPSVTLAACERYPGFRYLPGRRALRLDCGEGGRAGALQTVAVPEGGTQSIEADSFVLAAGALSSSEIFMRSLAARTGEPLRLAGLMDNPQVLMPFLNLGRLGAPSESAAYQFHLLGLGLVVDGQPYVHGQITTLTTGLLHPSVQNLPFGLAASDRMVRALRGAIGVVNVNFADRRREGSYLELKAAAERVHIRYEEDPALPSQRREALRRLRDALRRLGCVVPGRLVQERLAGSSVHYAGTLPMTREAAPLTTTPDGRSRDLENVFIVDGATFPELPAKNISFTLMANACRVAAESFPPAGS